MNHNLPMGGNGEVMSVVLSDPDAAAQTAFGDVKEPEELKPAPGYQAAFCGEQNEGGSGHSRRSLHYKECNVFLG